MLPFGEHKGAALSWMMEVFGGVFTGAASGRFLVVPEGLDRVFTYRLDAERGKLALVQSAIAREGSGPRHIAFDPAGECAYVVNELDSTVTAYRFDRETGHLAPFQLLSTCPTASPATAAPPRSRSVATGASSTRPIAAMTASPSSGSILRADASPASASRRVAAARPLLRARPRGRFPFTANEDSDTIVTFAIDPTSGQLTATGEVLAVGSPVCILFWAKPL